VREHEDEPVPGLPAQLPPGERILWQGAPRWPIVARRVFHLRKLALYFALLSAWPLVAASLSDGRWMAAFGSALLLLALGCAAIAVLAGIAVLIARSTLYTITNRRVAMRFGIALPMCVNLPFAIIESASLKTYADGSGDLPMALRGDGQLAYIVLWPHARPWQLRRPQPMLRAVPDAAAVAQILAGALSEAATEAPPQAAVASGREFPRAARHATAAA
jgi:hypothetical protein